MGRGLVAACTCALNLHLLPRAILCDIRFNQAPVSLSRQRSCVRHPARETPDKQDRQPSASTAAAATPSQHSLFLRSRTIHHCDTHPARLSPTGNRYICTCSPFLIPCISAPEANIACEHTLK